MSTKLQAACRSEPLARDGQEWQTLTLHAPAYHPHVTTGTKVPVAMPGAQISPWQHTSCNPRANTLPMLCQGHLRKCSFGFLAPRCFRFLWCLLELVLGSARRLCFPSRFLKAACTVRALFQQHQQPCKPECLPGVQHLVQQLSLQGCRFRLRSSAGLLLHLHAVWPLRADARRSGLSTTPWWKPVAPHSLPLVAAGRQPQPAFAKLHAVSAPAGRLLITRGPKWHGHRAAL